MIKKLLCLAIFLASHFTLAEEINEKWSGLYKGVYSIVMSSGEKTSPVSFELSFGERHDVDGFVVMEFESREYFGDPGLKISIMNLDQRSENSPPTVTDERFYLPAIFAAPTEFEAKVIQGGFNEELIEGRIITYKLSIDEDPLEEMHIVFKAGRLRK